MTSRRGAFQPFPSGGPQAASPARTASSGRINPSPAPALSPMPTALLPVATAACRVPVADLSESSGRFIAYPDGQVIQDSASVVALPGGTPGQIGANPGVTYDQAAGMWLPVPLSWNAPSSHL